MHCQKKYNIFNKKIVNISDNKSLGWYSRLNAKYRDFLIYLCRKYRINVCYVLNIICILIYYFISVVPYIGAVVRTYYKYMLLFTLWFAQKWPILAWLSLGKKNSHINMY